MNEGTADKFCHRPFLPNTFKSMEQTIKNLKKELRQGKLIEDISAPVDFI
jgi:hypothetical protein